MKKILFILVCMLAVVNVNGQNGVVDELAKKEQATKKYDNLVLSPRKSIKENYEIIKKLMSKHKEKNYKEYTITIDGHYESWFDGKKYYYDFFVGSITIKGRKDKLRTISGEIIDALTELYSNSLDKPFYGYDYHRMEVNPTVVTVETGRSYKHSDGSITKEYQTTVCGVNTLYSLDVTSPLRKKIYDKVMAETGLTDKGCKLNWFNK